MDTHQYHINYDRLNDCISEKLTTYYKYQFVERQFIYIEFPGNCLLHGIPLIKIHDLGNSHPWGNKKYGILMKDTISAISIGDA